MKQLIREKNIVAKKGRPGDVKVAIAYPSLYRVGVSSLAHQMLYYYVNSLPGFLAERFYVDIARDGTPVSVETGSPLKEFDVVIFSVHYEPDYVNIVRMLRNSDVPPLAVERRGRPLVVVGGPPVIANPEPLSLIADVAVIGEIECTIPQLLEVFVENADSWRGFLESLNPENGFYVGVLNPERVVRAYVEQLPEQFHPIAQIQPVDEEPLWGRGYILEIQRGCSRGCRFCLEGCIFSPRRDRPFEQLRRLLERGLEVNGVKRVITIALSLFDHPDAERFLESVKEMGVEASLPSLRLETLTPDRLELISSLGQRTLVLAPETPCEWLARAIGKPLVKDKFKEVVTAAPRCGMKSLKLYFMVGLPGEPRDIANRIAVFVKEAGKLAGFRGPDKLKVTVTPFVPKPQTPLQRVALEPLVVLEEKVKMVRRLLGGFADVRVYGPKWAYVQTVLSRADRSVYRLILKWAEAGGGLGGWRRAVRELSFKAERFTGELRGPLPWSHIDMGSYSCNAEGEYRAFLDLIKKR